VEKLRQFERNHPGEKIRNDEILTLMVARKAPA